MYSHKLTSNKESVFISTRLTSINKKNTCDKYENVDMSFSLNFKRVIYDIFKERKYYLSKKLQFITPKDHLGRLVYKIELNKSKVEVISDNVQKN